MTFRTLCSLMDTLPLVEDFETYAVGTHPTVIPCWQGTVSLNTLVANLPGDAHSGSKVMRFEWSIYEAVVDQKIVLPTINTAVLPINTLQLSFWAKNVENTYNRYDPARVLVGVMDDPAVDTTFQLVDTIDIVGEEWSRYDVPLSSYRGMGRNIVILSCPSIGSHNNWYAYIDDLLIELVPPCPSVTGMALTGRRRQRHKMAGLYRQLCHRNASGRHHRADLANLYIQRTGIGNALLRMGTCHLPQGRHL